MARDERRERIICEGGAHYKRTGAPVSTEIGKGERFGGEDEPERGEPSPRMSQSTL